MLMEKRHEVIGENCANCHRTGEKGFGSQHVSNDVFNLKGRYSRGNLARSREQSRIRQSKRHITQTPEPWRAGPNSQARERAKGMGL